MHTWSADELRKFLDASTADPNLPIWRLAASTGMRRGELLGLRWGDVDLVGGRLSLRQQLVRSGASIAFGPPKTKAARRMIALDSGTVEALRARRAVWRDERLAFGPGYEDHDLVFCRPDGQPHDPDVVTHQFERAIERAGVHRIRFHDLRHTHATLLLKARVHPKVVQERLGHSSIAITLDTYSHVIPDMQDEAAAKIGAVVDGAR
jgi:integrase